MAVAFLTLLVGLAFFPVLQFEFIDRDVTFQVVENPYIRQLSPTNLWHILTAPCITSYYPVRTLSYALDYQVWGLNPAGFKFTNGLIHWLNVVLAFALVLRLLHPPDIPARECAAWWDIGVATAAAGVLAIHPVVVEPVVWVAGREELLMTLGALGCISCHIAAQRLRNRGGRWRGVIAWHAGAAACCLAACLSNAVGAVIPAVVLAWDLLALGPLGTAQDARPADGPAWRKILGGGAALWVVSLATIVIKVASGSGAPAGQPGMFSLDRWLLVAKVFWLNLQTLFRPAHLAFDYPAVTPAGFGDPGVVLGAVAFAAACLSLWLLCRQTVVAFGLAWLCLALAPSSQIMSHHIHRADRFLYLPLAGLAIAAAGALRPVFGLLPRTILQVSALGLALGVLVALETRSTRQVWTWQNDLTVWENTVRLYPENAAARCTLADCLVARGRSREAYAVYRDARKANPDDARIAANFAWLLATSDDAEVRDCRASLDLARRACLISKWEIPEFIYTLAVAHFQMEKELLRSGKLDEASANRRQAIDLLSRLDGYQDQAVSAQGKSGAGEPKQP